jgi:hypothetical protein
MAERAFYIYTPTVAGTYVIDDDTEVRVNPFEAERLNDGHAMTVIHDRGYEIDLIPRPIRLQERV